MKFRESAARGFEIYKGGRWRSLLESRHIREDEEGGGEPNCKDVLMQIEEILVDRRLNDQAKIGRAHALVREKLAAIRGENSDVPALAGETEEQKRWKAARAKELTEQKKRVRKQAATPEGFLATLTNNGH